MEWLSCLNKIKRVKYGSAIKMESTTLIIFFKKKKKNTLSPLVLYNCDCVQKFVRKVQSTFEFIFGLHVSFLFWSYITSRHIVPFLTLTKNYARATTSVKVNFLQERVSAKLRMNDGNIIAVFAYITWDMSLPNSFPNDNIL